MARSLVGGVFLARRRFIPSYTACGFCATQVPVELLGPDPGAPRRIRAVCQARGARRVGQRRLPHPFLPQLDHARHRLV